MSACGAAAIYVVTGSASAASAFWVAGTLVDLDHGYDYWRDDGFNLNVRRFLGYFESRGPTYLFLGLHGWEWPLGLLAALPLLSAPLWVWTFCAGWLSHLLLDQRFNRRQNPRCYFFAYRMGRRFSADAFYDDSLR